MDRREDMREGGRVKRRVFLFIKYISLVFAFVFLYWFLRDKDLGIIFEQSLAYNFVYFLLVTGFAYGLATLGWKYSFINFSYGVSFFRLFLVRLCGESFAIINPTSVIGGEALKAYMLRRLGVDYDEVMASLLLSRLLVILSLIFLLVLALFYLFDIVMEGLGLGFSRIELFVVLLVFFLFILYILFRLYRSGRFLSVVLIFFSYFRDRVWFLSLSKRLMLLDELLFRTFREYRFRLVVAFFLNMFHWLCGAFEIYLMLYFLGYGGVSFFDSFLMEMGISLFKGLGSFVPGQVGVEEYGNKIMLELVSVGGVDTWVSLSILRRSRQVFWVLLGMLVFPFFVRRSDLSSLKGV